jgi:hypothetical protein
MNVYLRPVGISKERDAAAAAAAVALFFKLCAETANFNNATPHCRE